LRPYSPVHLRTVQSSGDTLLGWTRRTRVDGDTWEVSDVPLGEEAETYTVRVQKAGDLVREVVVSDPSWTYSQTMREGDGVFGAFELAVAQNSARFGPGPFRFVSVSA